MCSDGSGGDLTAIARSSPAEQQSSSWPAVTAVETTEWNEKRDAPSAVVIEHEFRVTWCNIVMAELCARVALTHCDTLARDYIWF